MAMEPPYQFRLTSEELAVLFQAAAPPDANIDFRELLPEYSDEQRAVAMQVARRSLEARGVLQPGAADGAGMHLLAQAAVGATAGSTPAVVVIKQRPAEETQTIEYHILTEENRVSHSETPSGAHEFSVFADAAAFRQGILDELALGAAPEPQCPPGQLSQETFGHALAAAMAGDGQALRAALKDAPLPPETGKQLTASLSQFKEVLTIAVLGGEGEAAPEGQSLAFLRSGAGLWLLEAREDRQAGGVVALRPMSGAAAQQAVQEILGRLPPPGR